MAADNVDGSIRIDTRIDEKGFNKGIKNLGRSLKNLKKAMKNAFSIVVLGGAKALMAFTGIFLIIDKVIRTVVQLGKAILSGISRFETLTNKTKALKASFSGLKNAMYNIFLPLLAALLPTIQRVVDWLTRLFNILAQVIAALTGQKTVMQATADAAEVAAAATGKMAKNAKDTEKAADGALAAFDELNVLEMEKPEEETAGGGAAAGAVTMVPVESEVQKFADRIKAFFAPFKEPLAELGTALDNVWQAAKNAFSPISDWWEENKDSVLTGMRELAIDGIEWLTEKLNDLADWINENPDTFLTLSLGILLVVGALLLLVSPALGAVLVLLALVGLIIVFEDELKAASTAAWQLLEILKVLPVIAVKWLKEKWKDVSSWFQEKVWGPATTAASQALQIIGMSFVIAWNNIKNTWRKAKAWFKDTVTDPVKNAFQTALDWVRDKWHSTFTGVKDFVRNTVNTIIGFINSMISAVASGINAVIRGLNRLQVTVPAWVPIYGGKSWGIHLATITAPRIPKLATGAVIPPNSEFMALLGDQRSGRNLEAPEGLIRQIIQEELGNIETSVTIQFGGSMGALVRQLKPYIDKENTRIGRSLVKGSTA